MDRKLTPVECEELLRQAKPLLETIYDSIANIWQALNAFVAQMLEDPKIRAALRENPDLKCLFNGA